MTTTTGAQITEPISSVLGKPFEALMTCRFMSRPTSSSGALTTSIWRRIFFRADLKGFVLKSHYIPTAERAKVVGRAVPGIEAYGAITLNHSVGGFNPVALEIAGRSGAKIVWMPTSMPLTKPQAVSMDRTRNFRFGRKFSGTRCRRHFTAAALSAGFQRQRHRGGELCLERIAKHNMILATGHLGRDEIFKIVSTAREMGVKKIVVTHAEFPSQSLTGEEQKQLADMGAVIEHCFTTTHTNKARWEDLFTNVRKTGIERTILSTDLGQTINPPVAEGFALYAQRFLDAGFSLAEIRHMAATIPARLVEG